MKHKIKFKDGLLYYGELEESDKKNLYDSFEIFREMEDYYKQQCVITHWIQDTMGTGHWVKTQKTIRDAIFLMKEGLIERASFELDE